MLRCSTALATGTFTARAAGPFTAATCIASARAPTARTAASRSATACAAATLADAARAAATRIAATIAASTIVTATHLSAPRATTHLSAAGEAATRAATQLAVRDMYRPAEYVHDQHRQAVHNVGHLHDDQPLQCERVVA